MEEKDMAICRIDYMKWDHMQQIHGLVSSVRAYANTHVEVEDHIRQVTEQIEDIVEGRVGSGEYVTIVQLLRGLVRFVRTHRFEENDQEVIVVTGNIIKLVQGDKKMDQNQLSAMTFRRVKEAISKVALGSDFGDDRITTVAEDYANRIVSDVFGGKSKFEVRSSQFVDKYYEMDPETEDVLDNGSLVIDGMKVLLEDPAFRQKIHEDMAPYEISAARVTNRWATVENRKLIGANISFIAVYGDGIKRKVSLAVEHAWIVKKDSIPRIDTLMTNEGTYLSELPTAKMVAYLQDRIKVAMRFNLGEYKIQTGIDGDVIPLTKYLVEEGAIPEDGTEYTVWNVEGNVVFTGISRSVTEWAVELFDDGVDKYAGFEVGQEGMMGGISLAEFMREHGG